jgi:hypothetical protein
MIPAPTAKPPPTPIRDAPASLVDDALAILSQEPGRPPLGKVVDDLSLDVPRPVATAAVMTAALLR